MFLEETHSVIGGGCPIVMGSWNPKEA